MMEVSLIFVGVFVFIIGCIMGFLSGCYGALQFLSMNGYTVKDGKIFHKPLSNAEIDKYLTGVWSK